MSSFQQGDGPSSSVETSVWDAESSNAMAGDRRFAPGSVPSPWLFGPAEVAKKKTAQRGIAAGLFDGRF